MKRRILQALLLVLLLLIARPVCFLTWTWIVDRDERRPVSALHVDDASRLNESRVSSIVRVAADPVEAERQLQAIVRAAGETGQTIAIGGAQHSMGGHTITTDGIYVDMRGFNRLRLDEATNTLHAGAGALWSDILPYLDERGRSVLVMQSNNSFSVGGSLSVNCHGWQVNHPPIASTVRSFRLLKADGELVRCSATEQPELFALVLGGYGLFGVILDVELQVTENRSYAGERWIVPADQYISTFDERVVGDVEMAYGRLDIRPDHFLQEAILTVFHARPDRAPPALKAPSMQGLRREVFRGSVGSDYGKSLRWSAEKQLGELVSSVELSRNILLNEGVDTFAGRSAASVDILHEYFIPKRNVAGFIRELQAVVPGHGVDLLNVTMRNVLPDTISHLRYAREEVFGFVMLFDQPVTTDGEAAMESLTRALIDAALRQDGTYYLPYRLHATREQFYRAYPNAGEFFALKRKYDPGEVFSNKFYEKYR